jgi:hypothetical protein
MTDTRTSYQRYVGYCASIGNTPLTEERWGLFTGSRKLDISPLDSFRERMRDKWAHTRITKLTAEELAALTKE